MAGTSLGEGESAAAESLERLAVQFEQLALVCRRSEQPKEGGFSRIRRNRQGGEPARIPCAQGPGWEEGFHSGIADFSGLRQLSPVVRAVASRADQSVRHRACIEPA